MKTTGYGTFQLKIQAEARHGFYMQRHDIFFAPAVDANDISYRRFEISGRDIFLWGGACGGRAKPAGRRMRTAGMAWKAGRRRR